MYKTSKQMDYRTKLFIYIVFYFLLLLSLVKVNGDSMNPTLEDNQYYFANRFSKTYDKGDIVAISLGEERLVKRIVGIEGDKISVTVDSDGTAFKVNDTPIFYSLLFTSDLYNNLTVPEGSYYVIGDNYNNSYDSTSFGVISEENIDFKCTTIYLPNLVVSTCYVFGFILITIACMKEVQYGDNE